MNPRLFLIPAAILAVATAPSGAATEDWSLCRVPSILVEPVADDGGPMRAEAARISSRDDLLLLDGDVSVIGDGRRVSGERILIDRDADRLQASGGVEFADSLYRIASERIDIDNRTDRALFDAPSFELRDRHLSGSAASIEQLDAERSRFRDLTYSSCDPEDLDWHLRASEMEIDRDSGRGTARHARVYFQGVPFIYLPWFQFPIDDRRMSGVLSPTIGYSESDGGSLLLPVYLNLAPHYDMTVTPAVYGRRGEQLNTENRYLLGVGEGQLDLSAIDDEKFGDRRWYRQWRHRAVLPWEVDSDLLLARVSDGEYFDDFDSVAPGYNDTRHLPSQLRFSKRGESWRGSLGWQEYQTLDEDIAISSRPYDRLPRLQLESDPDWARAQLETPLALEWVDFERDDSVGGRRTHVTASARHRAAEPWYFFTPSLELAFTDYQLDADAAERSIHRALPTASIDSGLIFERLAGQDGRWLQTLEPRLFVLHTPYEDQSNIPDFDSGKRSLTYRNLFASNRFSGADRIGDASQVTLGVTSRLIDNASGDQLLQLRAGQIRYFSDRRVSLGDDIETGDRSEMIAELEATPTPGLRVSSRLVFTPELDDTPERDLTAGYQRDGLVVNVGYYFEAEELEQRLWSLVAPLGDRWTLMAKQQQSLLFDRPVENLIGVGYQSCCWGIKILAARRGDEDEEFADADDSIHLELTLKGLGQAGRDLDSRLAEAIPGYQAPF